MLVDWLELSVRGDQHQGMALELVDAPLEMPHVDRHVVENHGGGIGSGAGGMLAVEVAALLPRQSPPASGDGAHPSPPWRGGRPGGEIPAPPLLPPPHPPRGGPAPAPPAG